MGIYWTWGTEALEVYRSIGGVTITCLNLIDFLRMDFPLPTKSITSGKQASPTVPKSQEVSVSQWQVVHTAPQNQTVSQCVQLRGPKFTLTVDVCYNMTYWASTDEALPHIQKDPYVSGPGWGMQPNVESPSGIDSLMGWQLQLMHQSQ